MTQGGCLWQEAITRGMMTDCNLVGSLLVLCCEISMRGGNFDMVNINGTVASPRTYMVSCRNKVMIGIHDPFTFTMERSRS
jgi:hypothetical protein